MAGAVCSKPLTMNDDLGSWVPPSASVTVRRGRGGHRPGLVQGRGQLMLALEVDSGYFDAIRSRVAGALDEPSAEPKLICHFAPKEARGARDEDGPRSHFTQSVCPAGRFTMQRWRQFKTNRGWRRGAALDVHVYLVPFIYRHVSQTKLCTANTRLSSHQARQNCRRPAFGQKKARENTMPNAQYPIPYVWGSRRETASD